MHQHIEHILLAIVAGVVALIVTQCGGDDDASDSSDAELVETLAPVESTTTTTEVATTTTTSSSTTTPPVSVAPVLATDDPDVVAFCFATSMVSDVLVTGVRGDIDAVRRSIDRRSEVIRTVIPPDDIAAELDHVLITSDRITTMLSDDTLALDDKRATLSELVADDEFRASVSAVARFERDVCQLHSDGEEPSG